MQSYHSRSSPNLPTIVSFVLLDNELSVGIFLYDFFGSYALRTPNCFYRDDVSFRIKVLAALNFLKKLQQLFSRFGRSRPTYLGNLKDFLLWFIISLGERDTRKRDQCE